jgi:hypothetical protein
MVLLFETIFIIGTVVTAIAFYRASKKCCTPLPRRESVMIPPHIGPMYVPFSENPAVSVPVTTSQRPRPRKRPKKKKKKSEEEPLLGINFILTETSFSTVQEPECVICLEPFIIDEEVKTLKCEHTFHIECIDDWFEKDKTCPICRDEN